MIKIFRTIDGNVHQISEAQEGSWIALIDPTATELLEIAERYQVDVDDLRAPLDEEERSRIEVEDNYTLILVDIPTIEDRNEKDWYVTIPMGIIVTSEMIITVCLEDTPVLGTFMDGRVRNFFTYKRTRFILQMLYQNASMYLHYLRIIDKKSDQVEEKLHKSQRNQELIELLELEKSLVYFTTSLKSNEAVLEKLLKTESIKKYPEDTELLEDVITENKQAIENGQYLQRHPERNHGCLCVGNFQQPEYRDEIPGHSDNCSFDSHHDFQRLWNECEFQGDAFCGQSDGVCLCNSVFHRFKPCGGIHFRKKDLF